MTPTIFLVPIILLLLAYIFWTHLSKKYPRFSSDFWVELFHAISIASVCAFLFYLFQSYTETQIAMRNQVTETKNAFFRDVHKFSIDYSSRSRHGRELGAIFHGGLGFPTNHLSEVSMRHILKRRKDAYDEAYVNWNIRLPSHINNLQRLFLTIDDEEERTKNIDKISSIISGSITSQSFSHIDGCLAKKYRLFILSGGKPFEENEKDNKILGTCNPRITKAVDYCNSSCSSWLTKRLFGLSRTFYSSTDLRLNQKKLVIGKKSKSCFAINEINNILENRKNKKQTIPDLSDDIKIIEHIGQGCKCRAEPDEKIRPASNECKKYFETLKSHNKKKRNP